VNNYDIKRERPDLYRATKAFTTPTVPRLGYLMADGHGDPNTAHEYRDVVMALYTLSYGVRALAKQELNRTHTVGPLEGLWSATDLEVFRTRQKSAWEWTMMIVQPDWITEPLVARARERVSSAKPDLRALDRVRFEGFTEGDCVQTLYVGPYDQEGPTIARLHEYAVEELGLELRDRHHEIYLSDPRRTDPSRLRTILRQPVLRPTSNDNG